MVIPGLMDTLAAITFWQAFALSLVALIILVIGLNKGNMWVLNVLAQDEPLLSAVGVFMFLGAGVLSSNFGLSIVFWQVAGAIVAVSGVLIVRSDRFDISGLI